MRDAPTPSQQKSKGENESSVTESGGIPDEIRSSIDIRLEELPSHNRRTGIIGTREACGGD